MHPLKNLSVYGDGGVITTNSKKIAKDIKILRNHGLINRDQSKIWGYNSRLDELQAAYALIKLRHLEEFTKRYISIAKLYSENLSNKIIKPKITHSQRDVFHNYVIRVSSNIRDKLMNALFVNGIEEYNLATMLSISAIYTSIALVRKYLIRRAFVSKTMTKKLQNLTKFIK